MEMKMVTGETTTREMRKSRSAKQRAASRWWNTEAIDLRKKIVPIVLL